MADSIILGLATLASTGAVILFIARRRLARARRRAIVQRRLEDILRSRF